MIARNGWGCKFVCAKRNIVAPKEHIVVPKAHIIWRSQHHLHRRCNIVCPSGQPRFVSAEERCLRQAAKRSRHFAPNDVSTPNGVENDARSCGHKHSKKDIRKDVLFAGAADRDRTGTLLPARDFKSLASASSATAAYAFIIVDFSRSVKIGFWCIFARKIAHNIAGIVLNWGLHFWKEIGIMEMLHKGKIGGVRVE